MQAMLNAGGAVINITNVLLIGPGGHLDAANFFAAPAKQPPPKKAAVAAEAKPAGDPKAPPAGPKAPPADPKACPFDPKPPPKRAAVAADDETTRWLQIAN